MATFESQERRMPKINECLAANGLESLDACRAMLLEKGIDVEAIVKGVQPICFENAVRALEKRGGARCCAPNASNSAQLQNQSKPPHLLGAAAFACPGAACMV